MSYSKILVVEDEDGLRDQLTRWLGMEGYGVEQAGNGADALELVQKRSFNLVLLDLRLPDLNGLEVLHKITKINPDICIIVLTGYGTDESLVRAHSLGAFDFFEKPVDFELLGKRMDEALRQFWRQRQNEYQRQEQEKQYQFENILGESPSMLAMFDKIKRVATTDESVLLLGENGTGKNLVAGAIHYNSPRKRQQLIVANCTTLSESLAESELFGHEREAFTGATKRKIGRVECANLTTLLIDEVGELTITLQPKLLQFVQEKSFERVGGNEQIYVDTRLITATNLNLEQAVEEGRFRRDLFFRLKRFVIRVPPLRERRTDIPLLAEHFIKVFNRRNGKSIQGITSSGLKILDDYPFPGNVRELENIIAQAMLLENNIMLQAGTIRACLTLPSTAMPPDYRGMSYREAKQSFEKDYLRQIFDETGGRISAMVEVIGWERSHVRAKLKEYGLR